MFTWWIYAGNVFVTGVEADTAAEALEMVRNDLREILANANTGPEELTARLIGKARR